MSNQLDKILSEANRFHNVDSKVTGDINELSYISSFIEDNEIVAGPTAIDAVPIYALYCDQNRPPIARRRFTHFFGNFFPQHKTGNLIFYRLVISPFKVGKGYTVWKEVARRKRFKYQTTKFNNIKSTPEGWMVYLEINDYRKILGFIENEVRAARLADQAAMFYFGPNYPKLNFKYRKQFQETPELLALLQGKLHRYESSQKESL